MTAAKKSQSEAERGRAIEEMMERARIRQFWEELVVAYTGANPGHHYTHAVTYATNVCRDQLKVFDQKPEKAVAKRAKKRVTK